MAKKAVITTVSRKVLENLDFLDDLEKENRSVVLVSSFPRSGNTWLLMSLTGLVLHKAGIISDGEKRIHPREVIPGIGGDCFMDVDPALSDLFPGFFFKSHNTVDELGLHDSSFRSSWGLIHLFRSPEDCMASWYLWHHRMPARKATLEGISREEFFKRETERWVEFEDGFLGVKTHGKEVFVSYEQLSHSYSETLDKICSVFEITVDTEDIEFVERNTEFGKLQKKEKECPAVPGNLFFRKGKTGSGKSELSADELDIIENIAGSTYEKLRKKSGEI